MTANGEVGTIQPIKEIAELVQEQEDSLSHATPWRRPALSRWTCPTSGWTPCPSRVGHALRAEGGREPCGYARARGSCPCSTAASRKAEGEAGPRTCRGSSGMGKAAELAAEQMGERAATLASMRDSLIEKLPAAIPHLSLTGHPTRTAPVERELRGRVHRGRGHAAVPEPEGDRGLERLGLHLAGAEGIARALGHAAYPPRSRRDRSCSASGSDNKPEDVDYVVEILPPIVERLREMSPLYDKFMKAGRWLG